MELKKYWGKKSVTNYSYYILRYTATPLECITQNHSMQWKRFHFSLHKNIFAIFNIVTEKICKQSHSTLAYTALQRTAQIIQLSLRWNQVNELLGICLAYVVLISVVEERETSLLNHAYLSHSSCMLCNVVEAM